MRRRRRRKRRLQIALGGLVVLLAVATAIVLAGKTRAYHQLRTRPDGTNSMPLAALPPRVHAGAMHASSPVLELQALKRFRALGLPLYCGGGRGHYVALTFDDGPGPYTARALHVLRRAHVRSTFFLVGRQVARYPGLPRLARSLGALGDHTWSHRLLTRLSRAAVRAELAHAKTAIERATRTQVALFRPPYGARDRAVDDEARRLGLLEVMWNVDSTDSFPGPRTTWRRIAAVVSRFVHPGSIVLMHEDRGQTILALRLRILRGLRRRGLIPVSVPALLALDPPTLRQLRAGPRGCVGNGWLSAHSPARGMR